VADDMDNNGDGEEDVANYRVAKCIHSHVGV